MKVGRQRKVLEIIRRRRIATQEELSGELKKMAIMLLRLLFLGILRS